MKDLLIMFLASIIIGLLTFILIEHNNTPKVELPEEYQLITPNDKIFGSYNNGVLTIEFDNQANRIHYR